MNSKKFIGIWTLGLAAESSVIREQIETAFNKAAKEKIEQMVIINNLL